jgi:MFS transporter, OFA family, oxalate/formate antiporter
VHLRRAILTPFYGWYVVGVALVAQFVAVGTQTYASTVFLKPMTQDLHWTRSEFSAVQTVSTFVMGIVGFVIGAMIDRRGPRPLMLIGGIVCGAALIATSRVDELWQFYLARGVAQTVGAAMLGSLVVNVTISKWFIARRGMAVAIASAGVSLGGVLMTPLVSVIVDGWGWRDAWVALGFLVWILIIPSAFIIRRAPEDYGLHPDGMTPAEAARVSALKKRLSSVSEVQWTRREAIQTRTIWLIIMAYGIANIGIGALLLHLVPFLTDHGWSRSEASWIYSIQAWVALLSKPVWGVLMDRFHPRYLSAFGFAVAAVGVLALLGAAQSSSWIPISAAMALWGLGIGGAIPLQETVWANYFGRQHLGRIRAVAMPFSIIFGAGGPLLAGVLYDSSGSYGLSFVLFSIFWMVGFVLILMARPPLHPSARAPVSEPSAEELLAARS